MAAVLDISETSSDTTNGELYMGAIGAGCPMVGKSGKLGSLEPWGVCLVVLSKVWNMDSIFGVPIFEVSMSSLISFSMISSGTASGSFRTTRFLSVRRRGFSMRRKCFSVRRFFGFCGEVA